MEDVLSSIRYVWFVLVVCVLSGATCPTSPVIIHHIKGKLCLTKELQNNGQK